MKTYLGVDGGGSKTSFLLIDETGKVLSAQTEGPAYHLEIGIEALEAMLVRGIERTLQQAGIARSALTFAFLGLPAYGEDRALQARLDAAPAAALPTGRYRCGNDRWEAPQRVRRRALPAAPGPPHRPAPRGTQRSARNERCPLAAACARCPAPA